jgi:hypothetical protein
MALVVRSKVKEIVRDHKKRMSKEAWEALDMRVAALVRTAIRLCGSHKTIRDTEIYMAQGKVDK